MKGSFLAELKRRKVGRVAIGYGAAAFVILQIADLVFPALGVPELGFRFLVVASLVGFPLSLALAWVFDLTPEGVRRTGAQGEQDRIVLSKGAIAARGGVTLAALLLGATILIWLRPGEATGHVARGAEVIAVLPFSTTGENVEVLGEGMVDLLSRNLDQLGAIRTIDSRAILFRWQQRAQDARLPPEQAYALGRDVGAGSILWGNVLEIGGTVRMNAELTDVSGNLLAEAEVEGPADGVLALVDSLSVALVRAIWTSRDRPLPAIDLQTITTGDLDAIRAFLDGERYYRASSWDSAAVAFGRAIARDSAFALAYMRLAATLGWGGVTVDRERLQRSAASRALALIDRLPARAQTQVRALDLWVNGPQSEALDTLTAMIERYPDDIEALYTHTDVRYHVEYENANLRRPPAREGLAGFDRVLDMDPSFAPAFIHPLEVAFAAEDTSLIRGYYETLRGNAQVDSLTLAIYSNGLTAVRGDDDVDAHLRAFQLAFRGTDAGLGTMAWQASRAVITPLVRRAARLDAALRDDLSGRLRAQRATGRPGRTELQTRLLIESGILANGGRWQAARTLFDEGREAGLLTESNEQFAARMLVFAGFADPTALEGLYADGSVAAQTAALVAALDGADVAAIRAASARIEEAAAATDDPFRTELADLARAFVAASESPSVDNIAAIEQLLSAKRFQNATYSEPLWFRWLERFAEQPETRADAIAILDMPWRGDAAYEARRSFALARALEADGQPQRARALYRAFVDALADADTGLVIEREIAAATAALARQN